MKRPSGPSKSRTHLAYLAAGQHWFSAWWDKWSGWGLFDQADGLGHPAPALSVRQLRKESRMKCPVVAGDGGLPSKVPYAPSITLNKFPTLDSLLFDHNWDDDVPKGKRCLMVFIDDVAMRLLVKLENANLKASCVARTWDELLAVMEKLLKSGQVVWESDSPRPQAQAKRKK